MGPRNAAKGKPSGTARTGRLVSGRQAPWVMRRCVLKELATAPAAFGAAFNTSLPPCAVCPDPEHGRKRGGARVDLKSLALNYAVAEGHARPATGMQVCPAPPPPLSRTRWP